MLLLISAPILPATAAGSRIRGLAVQLNTGCAGGLVAGIFSFDFQRFVRFFEGKVQEKII
jgi:hypothetical protein